MAEATTQAPDAELESDQPDTPETEPAEAIDDEQDADQPAAAPPLIAQAEYTRSQQAFSQAKALLGLDKKATREQVIAAIEALQSRPDTSEGEDDEDDDPRFAEARQRAEAAEEAAFNAELRYQSAIYGEDFTSAMTDVINVARTSNDPAELTNAFAAFVLDHREALAAAMAEEPDDDAGEAEPPDVIGTSEGDRGPSARKAETPARRDREPGPVGAVRDIFAGLGIGSRDQT